MKVIGWLLCESNSIKHMHNSVIPPSLRNIPPMYSPLDAKSRVPMPHSSNQNIAPPTVETELNLDTTGPSHSTLYPQQERLDRNAMKRIERGYKPLSLRTRIALADLSDDMDYIRITPQYFGIRLDDFIVKVLPQIAPEATNSISRLSFSSIKKLVQNGHIYKIKGGSVSHPVKQAKGSGIMNFEPSPRVKMGDCSGSPGSPIQHVPSAGNKVFCKLSDRLELNDILVIPTYAHWTKQLAPPSGVMRDYAELNSTEESVKIPKESEDSEKLSSVLKVDAIRKEQGSSGVRISPKLREEALSWVLFKNKHVVCINKPYGVPITSTSKPGVNIADILSVYKYTYSQKPIICNYLDKETTGVVVLARTVAAFRQLGRMFQRRSTPNNSYWGFCVGNTTAKYGQLKMHLETVRSEKGAPVQIIARPRASDKSKVAITEFVNNYNMGKNCCFVSFYPLTSQKHQLRILAAHGLRCPLIGDHLYGGNSAQLPSFEVMYKHSYNAQGGNTSKVIPLQLHHRKLQLPYKNSKGEFICITAPLPPHMKATFDMFGLPSDMDDPLIPG